jgi:hypothetical protein
MLRLEKKRTVIWPAMFFSGFKLQPEKLQPEKKVQLSRLTGHFFRRVQFTTRKNYDRKNKRYSHLSNGGGSDLVGTLRPEKKTYSHLSGYVFLAGSNFNRKKLQPEKKAQSSGRHLETGKNYVRKKRYSCLVVSWRTKHKTQYTS